MRYILAPRQNIGISVEVLDLMELLLVDCLLPGILPPLSSLMLAVEMAWLLVGLRDLQADTNAIELVVAEAEGAANSPAAFAVPAQVLNPCYATFRDRLLGELVVCSQI